MQAGRKRKKGKNLIAILWFVLRCAYYSYIGKVFLPAAENLPVNLLASCFNKTSTSYKFYWFLSLLEQVELGESKIPKTQFFFGMIAHS